MANLKGPKIDPSAYIAESAVIIGDVTIGPESSVWPSAVIRGDESYVRVGKGTSIQDNVTVHTNKNAPTIIGNYVTVGHNAVIHAATVKDYCIIGMGSIILDGSVVGTGSIVGAGAVVTPATEIPDNSLVIGVPAKVVKNGDFMAQIKDNANVYIEMAKRYKRGEFQKYQGIKVD